MTTSSEGGGRGFGSRLLGILSRPLTLPLLTLRGRLLAGAGLLWAVLCITLLTYGWQAGHLLVDKTNHQHLRYEAELIRNSITYQVNARLQVLERLAQHLSEPIGDALGTRQLDALTPLFEGLVRFDLDSRIVDAWPTRSGIVGARFPDRDYARFMHAFQQPHVSAPFVSRLTGDPLVMMLVPLHDAEGRYTGFLGGVVNIDQSRLFKGFEHLRLGERGHVTITTAAGQRLYHPEQRQAVVELPDTLPPALDRALYGWQGEAEEPTTSGEPALVAYRQVWPADWIVGVHLPNAQAEAPLVAGMRRITQLAWWALGLVLPVLGLLIWLALRPLTRLARQARELRDGQRHLLEIPTRMPELRRVIDVINQTTQARRANLHDLTRRKALLNATLAASPQGMFVTDPRGRLTFLNEALNKTLGTSVSQTLESWAHRIHPEERVPVREAWRQSLARQQGFMRQFRFVDHEGKQRWLDIHTSAIHVEGEFIGVVGTVRDITQHRHDDALRRWEAEHDPLTGLLNRRGLTRRLEEALVEWQKTGDQTAVLLFDLDHFKPINDQGGHALGDRMLQRIAETIRGVARSSDHAARQGGDEFAVLLTGCSLDQAQTLAEVLRERVASLAIEHQEHRWQVTASIGISCFQPGDREIDAMLARADAASYRAKQGGRNRVVIDEDKPRSVTG
ncbi:MULTISPECIES: diguanylate cyclase [unclassified Halomonas]|uniref:sensor domain-containing diguanylate cyclase n=1 Tax=unclassified Halomonas TaxID=2609666 RepID=UPI002887D2AD|nr:MULTISPECIES: diguanylate cyclase [unclassified Halomonas]MDT0500681.1 diguanylate cyclase [Halomonas sp. PAR7]MDT0513128.1 diguanylate cyclase [Halomonas sp. LES1]MDT0591461.1 diguanylate cyclase [Halomonas sp. PAR8]